MQNQSGRFLHLHLGCYLDLVDSIDLKMFLTGCPLRMILRCLMRPLSQMDRRNHPHHRRASNHHSRDRRYLDSGSLHHHCWIRNLMIHQMKHYRCWMIVMMNRSPLPLIHFAATLLVNRRCHRNPILPIRRFGIILNHFQKNLVDQIHHPLQGHQQRVGCLAR